MNRVGPVVVHSAAARYPPSTTSDVPVMPDESSQARYKAALAISLGCMATPVGTRRRRSARAA